MQNAALLRPFQHAFLKRAEKHGWEQRKYVNPH
jgi:hypothetical protein